MTRKLRADAERNRHKVLAAAEIVFAAHGCEASTDAVAAHAGVGVGTVFRHFPTKAGLIAALLEQRMTALAAQARELVDTREGVFVFFERLIESAANKRPLVAAITASGGDPRTLLRECGGELRAAFGELVLRAQRDRVLRADLTAAEVLQLLLGVAHAAADHRWPPRARQRALTVVFDGLRQR